jgi:Arc/MetJ family transcription regulator
MNSTEAAGVGHCGSKARCASSLNTLCQALYMRLHIELDNELVAQIDQLSGPRSRSAFVRSAIESALRQEIRWSELEAAAGAIADQDHDWDADPGVWVRQQRQAREFRKG